MSWERDEWKSALRADRPRPGDCHRHLMVSDGSGGGICADCGMTVDRKEL